MRAPCGHRQPGRTAVPVARPAQSQIPDRCQRRFAAASGGGVGAQGRTALCRQARPGPGRSAQRAHGHAGGRDVDRQRAGDPGLHPSSLAGKRLPGLDSQGLDTGLQRSTGPARPSRCRVGKGPNDPAIQHLCRTATDPHAHVQPDPGLSETAVGRGRVCTGRALLGHGDRADTGHGR
ncbi:hypothetical protein D3C80_1507150 [compost metagenome]